MKLRSAAKGLSGIRNMRIVSKLIVGYIVLIAVPFSLFAWFVYEQTSSSLLTQHLSDREKFMGQQLNGLEAELTKIESLFPLFQNNDQLLEYLEGRYKMDWEMIYYYRKGIVPTISFAYSSSEWVDRITIYKYNPSVLSLNRDIEDAAEADVPISEEQLGTLQPGKGKWVRSDASLPKLYYVEKLYNSMYTQQLGFLVVETGSDLLSGLFETDESARHSWIGYTGTDGKIRYASDPPIGLAAERLTDSAGYPALAGEIVSSRYTADKRYLAHQLTVPRLNLTILEIRSVDLFVGSWKRLSWMVTAGALLLAGLSALYFMTASSLANRLIRFSRYLKRVDDPKLAVYSGYSGNDEIGFLINSYNAMIRRLDELTNHYHQSEIMKRVAEIRMLQAQINPHFIYNTLETMRMMAFLKGQKELADMASSLGNLLRYNLAGNKDEALFTDELEHMRNYIEIHKVRMGERLDYSVDVRARIEHLRTPRFILQPIVENSIKHGIGPKRGKGRIEVIVSETDTEYTIRIADNGAGIPPERLEAIREMLAGGRGDLKETTLGIGLHNVHERIKSYFGGGSGMSVDSMIGEWAVVWLKLSKKGALLRAEADDRG